MNVKTWTPLALAIVLGLIAAKVARDTIERNRAVQVAQSRTVKVVVARAEVAPGQELTKDMVGLGAISAEAPPPGTFTDPAALVGRVATTAMFPGQPVIDALLAPTGAKAGLQALVPRGMRAITLEVNETSGVAGMISPGCRVDVVTTLNGGSKEDTIACTIVQDVLVQAVGQRLMPGRNPDEKETAARSVTLIATPRDAEAIELASSAGRTRLVLRGSSDRSVSDTAGVTFVELRGDNGSAPPVAPVTTVQLPPVPATQPVASTQPAVDPFEEPARIRRRVVLIKGGTRSEVTFDLPGKLPDGKDGDVVTSTNEGVSR